MAKLTDIINFKGTSMLWKIFWPTLEAPPDFEEMLADFIDKRITNEVFFRNFIWTVSHDVNDGHPGISTTSLWIPKEEWPLFADLFHRNKSKLMLSDPSAFINRIIEYYDTRTYAIAMAKSRSDLLSSSAGKYFDSVVDKLIDMENEIWISYSSIREEDLNFRGSPMYFVDNNMNSRPYIIGRNIIWRLLLLDSGVDYRQRKRDVEYKLPERFTIRHRRDSNIEKDFYELAIGENSYRAYPYRKNEEFESFIKQCCCQVITPELDMKYEYQTRTNNLFKQGSYTLRTITAS